MKGVLNLVVLLVALHAVFGSLNGTTPSGNSTNKPSKLEGKVKDEMIKVMINLMAKMIGGETVVCTSIHGGEQVVLEGNTSGTEKSLGSIIATAKGSFHSLFLPAIYIVVALTSLLVGNKLYKWFARKFW